MGTRTFEADLRRRLLAFVAPTLAAVAIAAVSVTWWALGAGDEASARFKAGSSIVAFETELAEGDAPSVAAHEVIDEAAREGVTLSLRTPAGAFTTPHPPHDPGPGACTFYREDGEAFRACRVVQGSNDATLALRVTGHVSVVERLAIAMLVVVLVAAAITFVAARVAIRKPVADVRALARWSGEVTAREAQTKAPDLDTEELRQLGGDLTILVERLTDALARERSTSAHIAHELRTPLTSLRAEVESMNGDHHRALEDIDRMARAIDAILLLATPQSREASEVVNVADVARALAPTGTTIEAPDEALIDANERLVELVLTNLFENARVHASREASLVRVTRVDDHIRVAVADDGPGVDAEMLSRLFDAHVHRAGSPGLGLGLSFVRAVANRYDGTVDARARQGGGLEVGVTFGRVRGWHD